MTGELNKITAIVLEALESLSLLVILLIYPFKTYLPMEFICSETVLYNLRLLNNWIKILNY